METSDARKRREEREAQAANPGRLTHPDPAVRRLIEQARAEGYRDGADTVCKRVIGWINGEAGGVQ